MAAVLEFGGIADCGDDGVVLGHLHFGNSLTGLRMAVVHSREPPAPLKWYYRPVWVLALLFLVLGPLALPYLWKSPRFSRSAKVALTVLVIVYTGLFIDETIQVARTLKTEMDAALRIR